MLAHKISDFGLDFAILIESVTIFSGSIPVSAILPAKIDSIARVNRVSQSWTHQNGDIENYDSEEAHWALRITPFP